MGAIQNKLVVPTTEPVHVQRDELHSRISTIIKAAAASEVNILCMQECWSEYIYIAIRLGARTPWVEVNLI